MSSASSILPFLLALGVLAGFLAMLYQRWILSMRQRFFRRGCPPGSCWALLRPC